MQRHGTSGKEQAHNTSSTSPGNGCQESGVGMSIFCRFSKAAVVYSSHRSQSRASGIFEFLMKGRERGRTKTERRCEGGGERQSERAIDWVEAGSTLCSAFNRSSWLLFLFFPSWRMQWRMRKQICVCVRVSMRVRTFTSVSSLKAVDGGQPAYLYMLLYIYVCVCVCVRVHAFWVCLQKHSCLSTCCVVFCVVFCGVVRCDALSLSSPCSVAWIKGADHKC